MSESISNGTVLTEDTYGLQVCRRQPVVIDRGEGVYVWDEQGRKILDFTSGWGVTCLGHSHPVVTQAIQRQASRLIQNPNSGFTYSPARASLMVELAQVMPGQLSRFWFANSGAEANDAALKLARKITGRQAVLALHGAFHGRTLASLSVSGGPANAARYLPQLPEHYFEHGDDHQAVLKRIDEGLAAVIVELVQGEGGVRALDRNFARALQEACNRSGTLLIVDEVQTGFCRTGSFFACEQFGLSPDMMTLGKGIAGGLPLAALAMTHELAEQVNLGDHGGTYCGNPLVCAVATDVIRYLRSHAIAHHVQHMGAKALGDLQALQQAFPQLIRDVRGHGLMLALELHDDSQVWPLTDVCLQQGLLVTPTRNAVVRLLPSLLLTDAQWAEGLQYLQGALVNLWHSERWASMRTA